MQQDPSLQGICGCLLVAMLQESCRRMAQTASFQTESSARCAAVQCRQ